MSKWVENLIDKEYTKCDNIIGQLVKLKYAVRNTEEASWLELLLVKYLGTDAGGLIHNNICYTFREYKFKLYYTQDENTSTDLHS